MAWHRRAGLERALDAAALRMRRGTARGPVHADAVEVRRSSIPVAGGPPSLMRLPDAMPRPAGPVQAAAMAATSVVAEECRLLRARIGAASDKRRARCIGVVSATPGEGKTTVALALAATIAREPSQRVLLIEGDLRHPSMEGYLDLPPSGGLGEWLEGSQHLAIRAIVPPGFSLLTAGHVARRHPELLYSRRMRGLLEVVRQSFEFIIIDCPPLAPVADSVLLQDHLDGFLLVVRAGHSSRDTLKRALTRLKPERVLGAVFNGDRAGQRYYKYGYSL